MKHRHHIIPRHAGGTDDPSNIALLSVAEHAQAHLTLWEKYGREEDYLAWKGLSGKIGKEEIQYQLSVLGGKRAYQGPETQEKKRRAMMGRKQSDLHKKRRSAALKGRVCCSPEAIERMRQTKRRLTDEQVKDILTSTEKGVTLGNKYGVGPATISRIRNRKAPAYKHLF